VIGSVKSGRGQSTDGANQRTGPTNGGEAISSNVRSSGKRRPPFWGETPCEHSSQFYANDGVSLDTLAHSLEVAESGLKYHRQRLCSNTLSSRNDRRPLAWLTRGLFDQIRKVVNRMPLSKRLHDGTYSPRVRVTRVHRGGTYGFVTHPYR
jgi:hypothetical protein